VATKPEAYVDTSALIALVDRSDSFHPLFRHLFSAPPKLYTTPLVVAEGHGWFLKRYDRLRAMQFMAMIEAMTPLTVLDVGAADIAQATAVARRFADQDLTLADALGLHLMAKRKTRSCWSTDFHLGLGGVPLVINA
jgi:predicted nucleic acid-binding protein